MQVASNGFQAIVHDCRVHGRPSQPWTGHDLDTNAGAPRKLVASHKDQFHRRPARGPPDLSLQHRRPQTPRHPS